MNLGSVNNPQINGYFNGYFNAQGKRNVQKKSDSNGQTGTNKTGATGKSDGQNAQGIFGKYYDRINKVQSQDDAKRLQQEMYKELAGNALYGSSGYGRNPYSSYLENQFFANNNMFGSGFNNMSASTIRGMYNSGLIGGGGWFA